jgi:hypothetical protein
MIDTKIILNTKKNIPFDIISGSISITRLQVLKSGWGRISNHHNNPHADLRAAHPQINNFRSADSAC